MDKRLRFISYSYAIGAILVVLGHSTPTGASDLPIFIDRLRTFIYSFHMPLFFYIAGFLFKYTCEKRRKPYHTFIKNKAVRFLTPYFVLTAVGIIPKILLSQFVNDEVSFSWYYVFESVFNPRLNVWGHFWFLPTLLIIFIFSYLILESTKNRAVFTAVLILSAMLAVFPIQTNWLALHDICLELIYFCMGIATCSLVIKKRNIVFRLPVAVVTATAAVLIYIITTESKLYYYNNYIRNSANIAIAMLMIYAILCMTIFFENKGSKILDYFEGKTFSIYIISWPCQAAVEVLLNRVMHLHWYVTVPAMFFAGIGIPLLFLWIYGKLKHHPKLINLIFGVN